MDSRIPKLEGEIVRLEQQLELLQRQWDRRFRLAAFALLAIPAYLLFGGLVAGVVLACTPALVAMQTYLLYVRRAECRALIREARNEIAYLRGESIEEHHDDRRRPSVVVHGGPIATPT